MPTNTCLCKTYQKNKTCRAQQSWGPYRATTSQKLITSKKKVTRLMWLRDNGDLPEIWLCITINEVQQLQSCYHINGSDPSCFNDSYKWQPKKQYRHGHWPCSHVANVLCPFNTYTVQAAVVVKLQRTTENRKYIFFCIDIHNLISKRRNKCEDREGTILTEIKT